MNTITILTTAVQQQLVKRTNTNKPEIRHKNIITNYPNYCKVIFVDQILTSEFLKKLNVHNPLMIDYLENCYNSFVSNPDRGYNFLEDGITAYTVTKSMIPEEKIKKLDYWKQAGIWGKDTMTPIFSETWETVLKSANNGYLAHNYISKNGGEIVYCLNMYPGHHASYDTYGGYCFLNNGAICAQSILNSNSDFKHVVILDLDHHCGDGTSDIFKDHDGVTTVSIHANPELDYPFYLGYEDENTKQNMNIIFNGCETKYLTLVEKAMSFINSNEYDVLIIAFGGDTYKNDPDASEFCKSGLDIQDYYDIGKFIKKEVGNKPIIITQEGGYDVDHINEIVFSFLNGLNE